MYFSSKTVTVDKAIVDKYIKISKEASWWDKKSGLYGLYVLQQKCFPSLTKSILEHFKIQYDNETQYLQGLNVLDVGCGVGFIAEPLAKLGAKVTGIDVCDAVIDHAIEHSKLDSDLAGKLHYQASSIEDFSVSNKDLYDVVITAQVLDFVKEPDYFLKLCCLKTKPGGVFIVQAKNRTITSFITLILWGSMISKQIPKGLFTWTTFNKPDEITKVLKENRFFNSKIVGLGIPLFFSKNNFEISDNHNTFYMVTSARKQ